MSAFDSMVIEGVSTTPAASPASPFASMQIVDEPFEAAKPAREPAGAARMAVAGGAELVDLLWTGAFGMPLAATREGLTRVQRTVESQLGFGKGAKMTRKEIGQEASADATRILDQYGSPALSLLRRWGFIDTEDRTAVEQGFAKIMEKVEETGTAVEERTGGKVLKEDVTQAVNLAFGALGVKGTQVIGKGTLSRMKANAAAKELDKFVGEKRGLNTLEVEGEATRTSTPVKDATNLGNATILESLTPEAQAAAKAQRKAMRKEMRARFAGDAYDPARPDSPQAEAARVRQQEDRMPAEGARYEMPRGYGPDPSMDWLRGGAAVGVGLGSLYALSQDNPEVAAAMAAGGIIAGRGKGITLEALKTMPDATPLGRILDQSAYTLSTLEMLPKNRFEFGKDSVAQLLKRDSVTKAERTILQDVLDNTPGETITAKQLMEGVKARTGDFELGRVESDGFASYGLERIDRATADDYEFRANTPEETRAAIAEREADLPEMQRRAAAPEDARFEDYPYNARQAQTVVQTAMNELEELRAKLNADENGTRPERPTTTAYRLPSDADAQALGDLVRTTPGGHTYFNDAYGHTRSFVENGIRHVVEIQSNIAQYLDKALRGAKPLEGEALAKAEAAVKSSATLTGVWDRVGFVSGRAGDYDFFAGLRAYKKYEPKLSEALGHTDQTLMLEGKLLKNLQNAGPEGSRLADKFYEEWARGKSPEDIAAYERGYVDISEGLVDWLLKNEREFTPDLSETMRGVLSRYAAAKFQEGQVWSAEAQAAFGAAGAASPAALDAARRIEPMLKDWHKRLVREELASSAAKGEPTVRFADADTVAKVEGWSDQAEILRRNRDYYRRGSDEWNAYQKRLDEMAGERFSPEHQGIYDRYAKDVTKFLKQLGGKHVVDSSGHGWWEVPVEGSKATPAGRRVQQFGGLDADLAKAVAVIGGGAALGSYLSDPENKLRGSIQGAIVGLAALAASRHPGFRDAAQAAGSAAEYGLGLASTRVRAISEGLHWRMVKHEGDVLKLSHDALAATEKFSNYLRKLPDDAKAKLNRDILSGDFAAVLRQIGADAATLKEWDKVRATLNDLGERLKGAGKLRELLTDYYPRVVVDAEGLLNALGKEKRTYIDAQLDKARQRAARMGQELSPLEISTVINRALKSQAQGTGKPGFLKKRSVQEITPELEPFYAPASESLPLYIRAVVREIERAKFFGENLVRDAETGVVDLDTSIGNLVQQERVKGNLTPVQEAELTSILRSRFGPGERSMNKYLQGLKNLSYAGLLGHVTSAIPQMADTAMAFYAHGFLPTVKAMQAVAKRQPDRVTVKDVGLADHVVEELTGGTAKPKTILGFQLSSAKFLQKSFKYSGFSLTDQFGKNVHLNAAWAKYRGWAGSAPGIERIRAKYGKALGPEFDSLVADLREGRLTERTRTLLFAELSDMQPVSKLEVPQGYLDMPNGRVVYMLKTWMLKQADIVRRDVVQRAARGDKLGALEAGLRFSLILGISGASVEAVKNLLLGREDPLELSDIPNNVLKTFGWSEYTADRVRQGKLLETGINIALPPYKMWDEILARDPKAINYLPLVGRLLYADNMQALGISTGLHGAAKANIRLDEKRRREERELRNPDRVRRERERAKAAYEKRLRERERQ